MPLPSAIRLPAGPRPHLPKPVAAAGAALARAAAARGWAGRLAGHAAHQPALAGAVLRAPASASSWPTPPMGRGLLVVGCGDVGLRVLRLLRGRVRLLVLSSSPERLPLLRAAGAVPLLGNLDEPASLRRLAGLADRVLHLAPPPSQGADDPRTAGLLAALRHRGGGPRLNRLVYGSTSGVYGDAAGAWVDETRPVAPATDRARRRVAAEQRLRAWGRAAAVSVGVLRIPGIYGLDRVGGDPRERLRRGTPVLAAEDDVYTNHIHADDLARACVAALFRGRPQRVVHASDDTELRMGDYFDLAAKMSGLAAPPRLARTEAAAVLSPVQLSFMSESRRLRNQRLRQELRLVLRYPTVREGLAALRGQGGRSGG